MRLEFVRFVTEHNAPAIDKHHVGEHMLNLVNLVRGDENRALLVVVIIEQRFIKLLSVDDVKAQCRFIKYE